MVKEAVPYDFGGIAVIDQLTVAPLKRKDSKKSEKEEKPESTTQSTMSGPEEPSLRNVVTAAEDFIKVLATVSTSQSSTADSDKDETQSSEKKKRKNSGKKKKTTKKQKGKRKGRKRKQKAEVGVKIEEGGAVSPSGGTAEEVNALSNFLSKSHKHDQSSRNTNRVGDSEYELRGKEEPSNEVMKDEPAVDKETVPMTSPTTVQKKPESTELIALSTSTSTTTVLPHKAKSRRLRQGKRKKIKKNPLPSTDKLLTNTADNLKAISVPTIITITPTTQPEQQSFESDTEKRPVVSTASAPIVILKVKRNRSKERGEREGRKKRRKVSSPSPIVAVAHENSSADNLKLIPLTGAPTVPSVPTTERQASHRLDIHGGKTIAQVRALNSSFSVLKRQKSKERGLRSRRRKTTVPLSSENPLFHNSSENVLPILPTPETSDALNSPTATAAISGHTEETGTHDEWRLFSTITAPSIITKRHRQAIRQQRKHRKKAVPAALSDGVFIAIQTEQTPITFTPTPSKVATTDELNLQRSEKPSMTTSTAPVMSPLQLSIERAKVQFSRKKRRKATLSVRQQ